MATETESLLGAPQQQAKTAPQPRSRLIISGGVAVVALLCVVGAALTGYRAYQTARWKQLVGGWEERTQKLFDSNQQMCSSCAIVIPSDLLKGAGKGAAIDSHDCVVRFNNHNPVDAPAEDWGTKDNFRVVNAMNVDTISESGDKCFDVENPGCRRIVITWETPSIQYFMASHENAELLGSMVSVYWPEMRDVHQTLYDFANQNGFPVPMFGSSAYTSVQVFKHPLICGAMTVFGVPSDGAADTVGYIDPHGPPSAAHQYGVEHELYRRGGGVYSHHN